jgi:hypothetical protein
MITNNGIVYTWGENESGQCGHMPFEGATLNKLKKKLKEFADEADRPENKGNLAKNPVTKICAEVTDPEPIKVPTKVEFHVEIKKKMDLAKYFEMLMPACTARIDMRLEALNFIDTHILEQAVQEQVPPRKGALRSSETEQRQLTATKVARS